MPKTAKMICTTVVLTEYFTWNQLCLLFNISSLVEPNLHMDCLEFPSEGYCCKQAVAKPVAASQHKQTNLNTNEKVGKRQFEMLFLLEDTNKLTWLTTFKRDIQRMKKSKKSNKPVYKLGDFAQHSCWNHLQVSAMQSWSHAVNPKPSFCINLGRLCFILWSLHAIFHNVKLRPNEIFGSLLVTT